MFASPKLARSPARDMSIDCLENLMRRYRQERLGNVDGIASEVHIGTDDEASPPGLIANKLIEVPGHDSKHCLASGRAPTAHQYPARDLRHRRGLVGWREPSFASHSFSMCRRQLSCASWNQQLRSIWELRPCWHRCGRIRHELRRTEATLPAAVTFDVARKLLLRVGRALLPNSRRDQARGIHYGESDNATARDRGTLGDATGSRPKQGAVTASGRRSRPPNPRYFCCCLPASFGVKARH